MTAGGRGYSAGMTDTDKDRVDQLTSAPHAVPEDARPRIDVTEHDGVTRIDVREDSPVKPPSPDEPAED